MMSLQTDFTRDLEVELRPLWHMQPQDPASLLGTCL